MINSIKEALSSAVTTAAQRVRNPVFGAFVLSWCAFNWKQILYLLFSDKGIYNKIEYISATSNWSFNLLLPVTSTLIICIVMPWANNIISWLQARPLDNSDSLEYRRKAKQIARATRLQRLEAKKDVTYEKVRTGAEKDIQSMKEEITRSKDRMGELTAELDVKRDELLKSSSAITEANQKLEKLAESFHTLLRDYEDLKEQFEQYKLDNPRKKSETQGRGIFASGIMEDPTLVSDYLKQNDIAISKFKDNIENSKTQNGQSPLLQALNEVNEQKD
ncbi:hypothetical protein ACP6PU_000120 [Cronobacter dublinensis]|nr:hypothetical protein [Cronobacter dublinensis]